MKPTTLGMHWKLSEESKLRQSIAQKKRFKENPMSEELRKIIGAKVSAKLKGRKRVFTQEWIDNLRKNNRTGKKHSEKGLLKLKESSPRGENHYRWIKDRTKLSGKGDRRSCLYTYWRKQIWLRDNFTCKIANPDCLGKIEAHHILGWSEHPELRYQLNNGITLCHAHHPRKRAEEKRLIPTFQGLVSVSKETF